MFIIYVYTHIWAQYTNMLKYFDTPYNMPGSVVGKRYKKVKELIMSPDIIELKASWGIQTLYKESYKYI